MSISFQLIKGIKYQLHNHLNSPQPLSALPTLYTHLSFIISLTTNNSVYDAS
jgi:hypothetical protein